MKRRSPSLPKSIFKSRAFLRRPSKRAALTLALALLWLNQHVGAANTQYNVKNSSTDLTATGTYTTGGTLGTGAGGAVAGAGPTVTSDVTFDSGVTYSPTAFTLNSSVTFGSLNDLSTTTLTIANTSASGTGDTLTLGGSGDPGSSEPGAANGDLFFVGTGATLNINSGAAGSATALGIVLGQSGNFDVAGTGAATISSIISGTGFGITKTGTGTLTLSGANTFSGGLTDTAGTVNAQSAAALGTGAFGLGASSGTASATLQYNGGSNFTVANAINVNAGSSGTLQITATSGAPTLSGLVTLSNNLLLVNTNSAGTNSLNVTGGIAGTGNVTFSATSAGGSVISGTALTFTGTLANTSTGGAGFGVTANLSGAESFLQNSATSTTTLSGTNANTGTDTVAQGTLEFTKEVSLFNQTTSGTLKATASNLIVQAGATAAFQVGNTGGFTAADIAALNALGTSTGGFENGSRLGIDTTGASLTLATAITNSNSGANAIGLTKLGANTLTLTGTSTYTGPTTITAGTLQIGGAGSLGSGTYASSISDAGTLEYSSTGAQTLSGSIGGGGGLTKDTGTGTLTLSGVNTFTGVTSVTAGTLDLANSLALQNSAVSFTSATGAITFDSAVTSNSFVFGGVGTAANNSYVLQNNAATPAAINLQIGNPLASVASTTSGVFSGAGNLVLAGFNNTITLTGANTYTGTTTVTGSTLNLGGAGANGSINSSSALVLGSNGFGGTLAYTRTGTVAQTFNGTTINSGENFITTSTANQTLNLGALAGNPGGSVDINPFSGSSITTTSGNTNGIIGGFATFGGKTTWAVGSSTPGTASVITGLSSYTSTASALNVPASYTVANVDVLSSQAPTAAITPNSLRFNSTTAYTLTLTGLNTITSGGILVTPTAVAGGTITGGFLTGPSGGELVINDGRTGPSGSFTIASTIVDNGAPTALVISTPNNGNNQNGSRPTNGSNSYSGGSILNGYLGGLPNGTPLGTGPVTLGNLFNGAVGYGGIALGSNVVIGLLNASYGSNTDNGQIAFYNNMLTVIGSGTGTFNGTFGTSSAPSRDGTFAVDSGTEILGALPSNDNGVSSLVVNGGTLQLGNGYSGTLANGTTNVTLGGGNYSEVGNVAGFYNQTFTGGIIVNPGGSTVTVNSNGGAGTVFSPGAITRTVAGGTVNFSLPTAQGGAQTGTNGITTTTLNTNGIIGGYATVGGTDWATNATNTGGGNIIGLSNSTINSYTASTAGTTAPGATANVDFQASNTAGFATQSINSLRFNTAGANTLTNAGTLTISSGGILETANVGSGNATTITGGTLQGSTQDLVVIQNNAAGLGSALTINSQLVANGTSGLTKSGPGELILAPSVANTFTGGMYLNGGVLNTTTNGIGAATSFTFNSGTLQAANTITSAKGVTIGATGGTIDTNGNSVTLSGNVTNIGGQIGGAGNLGGFNSTGAFALTKIGAGILTLSGTGNAFGGPLIINNGTVLDSATSGTATFGTGYITFGNNANTPTLDLGGKSPTVAGLIGAGTNGIVTSSVTGTPIITLNGVSTQTFGGVISNGSATVGVTLNLSNPTESQILTNTNTYTGVTTLTSGLLQLGNGTTGNDGTVAGAITDNTGVVFNYFGTATTPGVISGTGTVSKIGAGTAILTNADTYTGTTTISGGTLQLGNGATGNDGSLASASIVDNSALVYNTVGSTTTAGVISGTGSVTETGTGTVTLTKANTYMGTTTISGGTLQLGNGSSGNDGWLASGSIVNNAALVYNTFGSTTTPGIISGTGTVSKIGAGTAILTNADTYTGTTTISGGTLQLGNGATGNDGSLASASIVNNSALVYNTFGSISTAGVISGTGTVSKTGAGTVTLSGANTYTGATTISGGTLAASGTGTNQALGGTTNIAINNGGTLLLGAVNQVNAAAPVTMGTTSTMGSLTVAAGASQGTAATVSATSNGGAPSGMSTQGLGALTLNSTSTLNYGGGATTLVFGAFTANNGSVLNVNGYTNTTATSDGLNSGAATDDRLVFSNGGNTANNAALTSFDFGSGPGVGVFEVNLDNGFYEVAVPEPSTWVGGMLLVGTAVWQYRRRSRKVLS